MPFLVTLTEIRSATLVGPLGPVAIASAACVYIALGVSFRPLSLHVVVRVRCCKHRIIYCRPVGSAVNEMDVTVTVVAAMSFKKDEGNAAGPHCGRVFIIAIVARTQHRACFSSRGTRESCGFGENMRDNWALRPIPAERARRRM